jgi:hypothetical protein
MGPSQRKLGEKCGLVVALTGDGLVELEGSGAGVIRSKTGVWAGASSQAGIRRAEEISGKWFGPLAAGSCQLLGALAPNVRPRRGCFPSEPRRQRLMTGCRRWRTENECLQTSGKRTTVTLFSLSDGRNYGR